MALDPVTAAAADRSHDSIEILQIGVVAIGRNEGERLRKCLESVDELARAVVYVDSGSSDGSIEMARSLTSEVVELDLRVPFTAARARNQGFQKLIEILPDAQYVFFVDGDCEVVTGWLQKSAAFLDEHRDMAVVWDCAGRNIRKNRFTTCCATWNGRITLWARRSSAEGMR